jgi:hypothetical protein
MYENIILPDVSKDCDKGFENKVQVQIFFENKVQVQIFFLQITKNILV